MSWRDALDSETRWLLDLVGGKLSPRPDDLDGQRLFDLLTHHRLTLLVADRLGPLLHEDERQAFAALQQQTLQANLSRTAGLVRLVALFRQSDIPLLAIKGAAYGGMILGDAVRRGGQDVDLLIQPDDKPQALALLTGLGYRTVGVIEWKSQTLVAPGDWPLVDLHIHLASQKEVLALEELRPFERSITVEIAGTPVPTLPVSDAIAYAAYHGLRHAWARLHWAFDVLAALDNPSIDWRDTFSRAEALGCERHLAAALVFVAEVFDRSLPVALTERPSLIKLVRPIVEAHLRQLAEPPSERGMRASAPLRHLLIELRLHHRWRERWVILKLHLAPSGEDRAALSLPRGLSWLYLPLKTWRILRRIYK